VDKQYELYCVVDRLFYDSPASRADIGSDFELAARPLPGGWERKAGDEWITCLPPENKMPPQGWKIHVSGCLDNAEAVLAYAWKYCVDRQIAFKFLRSRLVLHMRNAKYAPRGASGKLITIYPADEARLEVILAELGSLLADQPGPYILSDLRYGNGPLYVRYGGFTERYCENDRGELVTAIEDDTGHLVPDRRNPVFTVPEWVQLPAFLVSHLKARNAATVANLPYRIERALHFSNGGGVYAATDTRTGAKVVIKEARPHAGLAGDGADAVTRLDREHEILRRLDGIAAVPRVCDYFEHGGHRFLVLEFIEGKPLNSCYAEKYPLLGSAPDAAALASYTGWAVRVCAGAEEAVAQLHARGVIFNDLHMFNVMVRPYDSVALLDFEVAAHIDEDRRPTIGNPGFVAPPGRAGFDIDRYSLACLRLAMFMPMTMLLALDRGKAAHFADVIAEHFPVDRGFLDEAVREITRAPLRGGAADAAGAPDVPDVPGGAPHRVAAASPGRAAYPRLTPDVPGWERARRSMADAILASATPYRDDRLFPGDIKQFAGEGLGIAHGAAGVLYALSATGAGRFPEHEEWLIAHAIPPASSSRLGLYDGLLGVACVLAHLEHADAALKVAESCLAERWERLGPGLFSGLTGFAAGLLHLGDAMGEPALRDAGLRAAEIAVDKVTRKLAQRRDGEPRVAGLMRGAAGPALLFVRMYERTGDPGYLDLAAVALGAELDVCVPDRNGALQVDQGWRTLPYLAEGSAGIGLVAEEYLRHRSSDRLAAAVPRIRLAARSPFYIQSGLFAGRAGMIFYLSRRNGPQAAAGDAEAAAQIRRLAWHAVSYAEGLAFPGDQLMRLSMDLATGTAGVLLALGAAFSDDGTDLPFLGSSDVAGTFPRRLAGLDGQRRR
jgi:class III lanthionine synthetase